MHGPQHLPAASIITSCPPSKPRLIPGKNRCEAPPPRASWRHGTPRIWQRRCRRGVRHHRVRRARTDRLGPLHPQPLLRSWRRAHAGAWVAHGFVATLGCILFVAVEKTLGHAASTLGTIVAVISAFALPLAHRLRHIRVFAADRRAACRFARVRRGIIRGRGRGRDVRGRGRGRDVRGRRLYASRRRRFAGRRRPRQ